MGRSVGACIGNHCRFLDVVRSNSQFRCHCDSSCKLLPRSNFEQCDVPSACPYREAHLRDLQQKTTSPP